jgi:hypothetical protein
MFDFQDPLFGLGESLSIFSKRKKARITYNILDEPIITAPIQKPFEFCRKVKKTSP